MQYVKHVKSDDKGVPTRNMGSTSEDPGPPFLFV